MYRFIISDKIADVGWAKKVYERWNEYVEKQERAYGEIQNTGLLT